jgi:Fe2+ or Zn2+ uptake regulation protein
MLLLPSNQIPILLKVIKNFNKEPTFQEIKNELKRSAPNFLWHQNQIYRTLERLLEIKYIKTIKDENDIEHYIYIDNGIYKED